MASVSKTILIGHVGSDPEIKALNSKGDRVASFPLATSEHWKDRTTGERRERTEWHRIVVFDQNIVNVCENYVRKGSKLWVEGRNETRSWGEGKDKRYTTEVVIRPYRGAITMLDRKDSSGFNAPDRNDQYNSGYTPPPHAYSNELEDEIPF